MRGFWGGGLHPFLPSRALDVYSVSGEDSHGWGLEWADWGVTEEAVCPWDMPHHGGRDLELILRIGVD